MNLIVPGLACVCLLSASAAFAQSGTDTCHVYVVDVRATERFREKTDFDAFVQKSKPEQEAIVTAAGVGKTYEDFATTVGEEELTTKTYAFPKRKQVITASVFYTDESLSSTRRRDSMLIGLSVAAKATEDAISAPDAVVAEISYDENTDVVRIKKNIVLDGRPYVVGMECRCK